MKLTQIQKLLLSNFLTGLVFWYGIEKLFMASIGIDEVGVGLASAAALLSALLLDIPTGILADKWSRKGTLILGALTLALCSVIAGFSQGLIVYALSMLLFGLYEVLIEGSYQAVVYDSLKEEGRTKDYSQTIGLAYGLFLAGIGVANVASGFVAEAFSYQATFYISVVPCLINIALLLTIREPRFHRLEKKERVLHELGRATKKILHIRLLRVLTVVMISLTLMELFKADFGQLYILRYTSDATAVGVLWAIYAFMWALGSVVAHRFRTRLTPLIIASTVPLTVIGLVDHRVGLVIFMVQIVAAAALDNQIETRIQEATPSNVRASLLSTVTAAGTALSIPVSFLLGWVFRDYGGFRAVQVMSVLSAMVLAYWLLSGRRALHADDAFVAEPDVIATLSKD
ncbi:MFS transporter [Candidatus Saccharibacteria bacterium]|nr:MFS transporter [Candidatus Saccharibacteria bacterium]